MVPEGGGPRIEPASLDLREHDREVLEFLSQDPSSQVAFQGLRRRLGIHPEQLSRALHRLADDNLVEHTDLGYRVTPRAMQVLSPGSLPSEEPGVIILQTYLPANLDLSVIDGIVAVSTGEALEVARRLAAEEGMFCGPSSGINVAAVMKVAEKHPELHRIATIPSIRDEQHDRSAMQHAATPMLVEFADGVTDSGTSGPLGHRARHRRERFVGSAGA